AHLLFTTDTATLFVDRDKLDAALVMALAVDGVTLAAYADVARALGATSGNETLLLDSAHVASAVAAAIPSAVRMIEAA
uniref:aminopeptidase P family N-terminal domain-containing protein n=1 Tax=Klebsiella pneumoniae TaxID=573 RepID=UPI0025A0D0E1